MRAPLLLAALLVAGCAAEQRRPLGNEMVVVLPGPGGKAGGVVVKAEGDERLLDKPFAATKVGSGGKLESASPTQAEVHAIFAGTLEALPGKPASFLLYFLEGKDEFTAESKAEVERILAELKRRPAPDIVVIGHTDTMGNDANNDRLSLARAERVRELLVKLLSIPAERIQAAGRGERELLVATADNVSEARNRRVEINVR